MICRSKKIFVTPILLLISFFSFGQPSLQMGFGVSTQGYGTGEVSAMYRYQPVFVQAGYIASLTRQVEAGTYLNATAGFHLYVTDNVFVEPSVGYASIQRSNDRKYLNERGVLLTGAIGKDINDGSVLIKAAYAKNILLTVLAIRYNF